MKVMKMFLMLNNECIMTNNLSLGPIKYIYQFAIVNSANISLHPKIPKHTKHAYTNTHTQTPTHATQA